MDALVIVSIVRSGIAAAMSGMNLHTRHHRREQSTEFGRTADSQGSGPNDPSGRCSESADMV